VIDGRPVVLAGSSNHFGALRIVCGQPVVLALVEPTPQALTQMADAWGEAPVVVTEKPEWFWDIPPAPTLVSHTEQGEYALQHMPRKVSTTEWTFYVGVVEDDGTVTALPGPG